VTAPRLRVETRKHGLQSYSDNQEGVFHRARFLILPCSFITPTPVPFV
jgi:hypothetical protein